MIDQQIEKQVGTELVELGLEELRQISFIFKEGPSVRLGNDVKEHYFAGMRLIERGLEILDEKQNLGVFIKKHKNLHSDEMVYLAIEQLCEVQGGAKCSRSQVYSAVELCSSGVRRSLATLVSSEQVSQEGVGRSALYSISKKDPGDITNGSSGEGPRTNVEI